MSAIKQAVELLGLTGIANLYTPHISPQAVYKWVVSGEAPVERCPAIERATDNAVTRRDLRPSDWWLIWPELVDVKHPAPSGKKPVRAAASDKHADRRSGLPERRNPPCGGRRESNHVDTQLDLIDPEKDLD